MKKIVVSLLLICLFIGIYGTVFAEESAETAVPPVSLDTDEQEDVEEGLLPSANELFGIAMPSLGLFLGRDADSKIENDEGKQEIFSNFKREDYDAFGEYLAGIGAEADRTYTVGNETMTITIYARSAEMVFSYNWVENEAVVLYPAGTRSEKILEESKTGENIFPPIGKVMPSAEFAIDRKPDDQLESELGLKQIWNSFQDGDYNAFSIYLAEIGAELSDSSIEAGTLDAEISLNNRSFRVLFDWNTKTMMVVYPENTEPEKTRWNDYYFKDSANPVLPYIGSLGQEVPRLSMALKREPSSIETLNDGTLRETFLDFKENDYDTFSQYLQNKGCQVDDYHTDENNVLVIHLSNMSAEFTFLYDRARQTGMMEYPSDARVEKAWVEPTIVRNTPEPVQEKKDKYPRFTEEQCWKKAYDYFVGLRWKNPDSLKIYGHSTSYSDLRYIFVIDYSAENGFGGTNRGYYYITVHGNSGEIVSAFGSD